MLKEKIWRMNDEVINDSESRDQAQITIGNFFKEDETTDLFRNSCGWDAMKHTIRGVKITIILKPSFP